MNPKKSYFRLYASFLKKFKAIQHEMGKHGHEQVTLHDVKVFFY